MALKTKLFYMFVFSLMTTYVGYLSLRESPHMKLFQREIHSFLTLPNYDRKNNFLAVDESVNSNLLINTSNCKVPEFSPLDPIVIPFVHKGIFVEDCPKIHFGWTYRDNNWIVFNETALEKDKYKFESVDCCFRTITRVEQSMDDYDIDADNRIKYSEECTKMREMRTEMSKPSEEFVMIECSGGIFQTNIYRGFHAIAQPKRSKQTLDKIKVWEEKRKVNNDLKLPPNILFMGLDTTSRLNFRRQMLKTVKALESLGAVEMMGYTKVGESTHAAFSTMYSGYSPEELDISCHSLYPNKSVISYDGCPMIWQRFNEANYFTGQSEDWPDLSAFNGKGGFVKQPFDFYLRTLMNGAHDYGLPFPINKFVRLSTQWCIGHQTNDDVIVDYVESMMDAAYKERVPAFVVSWSGTYPHGSDHNNLQLLDSNYADLILRLTKKSYFDNTILVFGSDHGQRYGPLRETLIGWYEDKMPNFWIMLPQQLRQLRPDWQKALQINSRRLTTPYMFHQTLEYLLDEYSNTNQTPEVYNAETEELMPRKHKQHFLSLVREDNSCSSEGVPDVFCACYLLRKTELSDPLLLQAANTALSHLNKRLPAVCAQLSVLRLSGGARMDKPGVVIYIAGFLTNPGELLIEIEIEYVESTNSFSNTSSVQRANKINQDYVKCVENDKYFQLYCYCKS